MSTIHKVCCETAKPSFDVSHEQSAEWSSHASSFSPVRKSKIGWWSHKTEVNERSRWENCFPEVIRQCVSECWSGAWRNNGCDRARSDGRTTATRWTAFITRRRLIGCRNQMKTMKRRDFDQWCRENESLVQRNAFRRNCPSRFEFVFLRPALAKSCKKATRSFRIVQESTKLFERPMWSVWSPLLSQTLLIAGESFQGIHRSPIPVLIGFLARAVCMSFLDHSVCQIAMSQHSSGEKTEEKSEEQGK
jgi:hypothetical protein